MAKKKPKMNHMKKMYAFRSLSSFCYDRGINLHGRSKASLIIEAMEILGVSLESRGKDYLNEKLVEVIALGIMPKNNKKRTVTKRKPEECFYRQPEWLSLRRKIILLYGSVCMKCGVKRVEMHVDHIYPRSKYPELELSPLNLQVLCRGCNMTKGNSNTIDYRSASQIEMAVSAFREVSF